MKYLIQSLSLFTGIVFIEAGLLSLITWSLPNQVDFTLGENLSFFFELFSSNPSAALDLILIHKPVIVIQRIDSLSSSQVWGLYFMPITVLTLLLLAVFLTWIKQTSPVPRIWGWICLSAILLSISVFYLRVQSCCTASPSWLLEVMILSRVYSPLLDTIFWQDVYMLILPWLKSIQLLIASSSLLIFYLCVSTQKDITIRK